MRPFRKAKPYFVGLLIFAIASYVVFSVILSIVDRLSRREFEWEVVTMATMEQKI